MATRIEDRQYTVIFPTTWEIKLTRVHAYNMELIPGSPFPFLLKLSAVYIMLMVGMFSESGYSGQQKYTICNTIDTCTKTSFLTKFSRFVTPYLIRYYIIIHAFTNMDRKHNYNTKMITSV